jgi:hypothetical protein
MPRPIVVPWRDGYVRPRVPLRDPNPYCVLRVAAMLVHQTGLCMPPEMVGHREMNVLELLRGGWGFFGAPSCLQSVEPEHGVPNATSAAQFAKSPGAGHVFSKDRHEEAHR